MSEDSAKDGWSKFLDLVSPERRLELARENIFTLINGSFAAVTKELQDLYSKATTSAVDIPYLISRIDQYAVVFWGYENIVRCAGLHDEKQLQHLAEMRQAIEEHRKRALDLAHAPPPVTPSLAQTQEMMLQRQQVFDYTNKLREFVQGGMPFVQAKLLAMQLTGLRSESIQDPGLYGMLMQQEIMIQRQQMFDFAGTRRELALNNGLPTWQADLIGMSLTGYRQV